MSSLKNNYSNQSMSSFIFYWHERNIQRHFYQLRKQSIILNYFKQTSGKLAFVKEWKNSVCGATHPFILYRDLKIDQAHPLAAALRPLACSITRPFKKIKLNKKNNISYIKMGSVLVNDFWTPPTPPPPINFVHDQISIYLAFFRVRLG